MQVQDWTWEMRLILKRSVSRVFGDESSDSGRRQTSLATLFKRQTVYARLPRNHTAFHFA